MSTGSSEALALEAIDRFLTAFNTQDPEAIADTLNYPHVRIASGEVTVWNSPKEYAEAHPARFAKIIEPGWARTVFDSKQVIHSSADKVHVSIQFTRYDAQGAKIATYQTLYIVRVVAMWSGIQIKL